MFPQWAMGDIEVEAEDSISEAIFFPFTLFMFIRNIVPRSATTSDSFLPFFPHYLIYHHKQN